MRSSQFVWLVVGSYALVSLGQSKKSAPTPDDTILARRSFAELLSVKDQDILAAMQDPHTYVCYRRNKDEFLMASFGPEARAWTWTPVKGDSDQEEALEPVFVSDYVDGATDPLGVGLTVVGKWTRRKDSPTFPSFNAFDRPVDPNDTTHTSTVNINTDEFRLEETFQNVAGGVTNYALTIRRSTGRFTETYSDKGALTEYDGRCSIFLDGKSVDELPAGSRGKRIGKSQGPSEPAK